MKISKKLSRISATSLIVVSIGSAYAQEDGETLMRTHEQLRTQLNLQTEAGMSVQPQRADEQRAVNKNQNRYRHQYKEMNKFQYGESDSNDIRRMNTTNQSMSGSSITGSMNRQSNATRSMSGNRR